MNFTLTRVRLTAAVLLALSVALLALTLLEVGGPIRVLSVVAFGLVAPGWALVAYFPPLRPSLEWATAVGFSLTVSVLLGTAMLSLGWWEPRIGFFTLVVLTCCALTWHLLRPAVLDSGIDVAGDPVTGGVAADTTLEKPVAWPGPSARFARPHTVSPGRGPRP